jgi:NADH-quinone oxidoreductase subunit N
MMEFIENIHCALPEIIILITACVAILAELFLREKVEGITFYCISFGLLLAGIISYLYLGNFSAVIFNGLFVSDDLAQMMKIFIYITVFLSFFYSRNYIEARQMPSGDYYILGLFSALGMMILVSGQSLLTLYLGIELLSLPLYALTAIRRHSGDASEAALKYFVMGAIASAMLLYGFSLLYGATGYLNLSDIASSLKNANSSSMLLSFSLVFIVAGIGFKLAAIPFHMWAPDVYQGAPTSVTLLVSTAPKIAAMGMAFRLLSVGLSDLAVQWQQLVLVMSLLSVGLGNILAVVQNNLKRLFAYSAISHTGYALFGILAATPEGYGAALYYIIIYAITTASAFGLLVLMSKAGVEAEVIDDLKGLNKRNPWLAFMMLIVLFSMAGVPPTVGFFTKLLVLKSLIDVQLTWVAVLGLFFAVIGAFYYIRVIKVMYFDEPADDIPVNITLQSNVVYSCNSLSLLLLGIFPNILISACMRVFS